MYGSVTGNKGWQPTNEDYTSLFLNSFGGADNVYKALTDEIPWTDESLVGAIETSAEWYQKGYLGTDYFSLDWSDSAMLLAEGKAPFYFGPLKFIQNLMPYAVDENADNFGFTVFPAAGDVPATYTVGATGLLAINEKTEHKDVCAEFLDMMMTNDFVTEMAKDWPGYWAVPLTTLGEIDMSQFEGLSKMFMEGVAEACAAIDAGNFGYYNSSYMPAEAFDLMCVVDSVWLGEKDATEFISLNDYIKAQDADALDFLAANFIHKYFDGYDDDYNMKWKEVLALGIPLMSEDHSVLTGSIYNMWVDQYLDPDNYEPTEDDQCMTVGYVLKMPADNSGVKGVAVEDNSKLPVVFYTIDGLRVNKPAAGQLVIRRQGSNVSKVIVK